MIKMEKQQFRQIYLDDNESNLLESLLSASYIKINNELQTMSDKNLDKAMRLMEDHKLLIEKITNPVEFIR